jgi:hypothetical protein
MLYPAVHLCSSLSLPHDMVKPCLLTTTFTTAAFDRSSLWLFGASPCRATPVGIEPGCAHLASKDKVTFPRAPLQSRKVGFPDSGFGLGFPPEAFPGQVKLKRSLACTPTHSGLPLDSSLKSWFLRHYAVDHVRTAKCPELLCRSQALLATGWRQAPPGRTLPLLLRSYELMRQTSSLLRNSCIHTYFRRSSQVAASPCWEPVLPDVISAILSSDAWPSTPTVPPSALACFFPGVIGLPWTPLRSAYRCIREHDFPR